jgi:hypothetical protein
MQYNCDYYCDTSSSSTATGFADTGTTSMGTQPHAHHAHAHAHMAHMALAPHGTHGPTVVTVVEFDDSMSTLWRQLRTL